jgi:branched-chain amino acid transport system permease protein
MNSRALLTRLGMLAFFVVAAAIPTGLDLELQFDAALAAIYGLAILSLVLLTGYVGQISLCQATFMGISAFGTGMLVNTFHLNYFLAAPVGVLMSFLVGIAVGIPALRLRGILLAVVTLGVALVFDKYFFSDNAFAWFTGGTFGWHIDGSQIGRVKVDALHVIPAYWILLAILFLTALLMLNLHESGSGRRFRAIRDSELAAATMGVDLTRYKLLAFGISAAIAGVGGAFYPLVVGSVSAQPFSFLYSLQFAAIAVLMGIRYVPAAAIGGFFLGFMPVLLNRLSHAVHYEIRYDWFQVVLGALLIAQLILLPDGVWGDIRKNTAHIREALERAAQRRKRVAAKARPA